MLRPRIIPVLLVHNGGLTKTVKFGSGKYVGDPLNAVRIFNEKEVDEIFVVDIDATVKGVEPDYDLISRLSVECRMPLCYGGGVRKTEQVRRIVELGVEKVAISSAAVEDEAIIEETSSQVGSQSVVVVMDVRKKGLWPGDAGYGIRQPGTERIGESFACGLVLRFAIAVIYSRSVDYYHCSLSTKS